jgi:hypothetical protein
LRYGARWRAAVKDEMRGAEMSETMLGLGNNYVRTVLQTIQAFVGVDVTRMMFTFELSNKDQNSAGYPLWLGGRVEVDFSGSSRRYAGQLQPSTAQPIGIGPRGTETGTQLTLDLTDRQLWLIDEKRVGGSVQLIITLTGHAIIDNQYVSAQESILNHRINQSEWLEIIRQASLKRVILLELEVPDPQVHPKLATALEFYSQAQSRYREGEWRQAVECVRQSLAALVGKNAYKEARDVSVGYAPRRELVRRAAKFMADLGAHPEAAETRKPDAYAALMIAGGLLHAFAVQQKQQG